MKPKKQLERAMAYVKAQDNNLLMTWVGNLQEQATVCYSNETAGKEILGEVQADSEQLNVIVDYTNYQKDYARRLLKKELSRAGVHPEQIRIEINTPEVGSTVLTLDTVKQGSEHQAVEFNVGTYYYALDSDFPKCNGKPLRQRFKAKFIGRLERQCDGGSVSIKEYSKFLLTEVLQ